MKQYILNIATLMLILGYVIHAGNYAMIGQLKLAYAMVCFMLAMGFLFF